MALRIGIVVGEPSGDILGARLAEALIARYPNIQIEGVIGPEMIKVGCLQLCSMDILSVMGLIEPLKRLPQILQMRRWLLRYFLEDPPDLFIGIDSPDFNLSVEKVLHAAGIPTVHYVSPSVWAWRQGRIKNIKKSVDLMLALFPFETKFYEQHDMPVRFVGHPTADDVPIEYDKSLAKTELGFAADDQVVVVMPGSRNSEFKHMLKTYLNAVKICHTAKPNLKFVMPLLYRGHQAYVEFWRQKLIPEIEILYVLGNSYIAMRAANIALVTSGTATLELMLHKIPMVVAYKTNRTTYEIVKRIIKVKYIALPNLLANRAVVQEYIQSAATSENLAAALMKLLDAQELQNEQIDIFKNLHSDLRQGASERAADAIQGLLFNE